jgi:hypothetical protein
MPKKKWTIDKAGGDPTGADLIRCHIKQTDTGYDFTSPNDTVLKSIPMTNPPLSFENFSYDDYTWTVNVTALTNPATGNWHNNKTGRKEEEGTWSAGATEDDKVDRGESATAAS